jgi:hypothetical protein
MTWMNLEDTMLIEISESQKMSAWNFTYMRYQEESNSCRQKAELGFPGTFRREEGEFIV